MKKKNLIMGWTSNIYERDENISLYISDYKFYPINRFYGIELCLKFIS